MSEVELTVIDGLTLDPARRALLRPDEMIQDVEGRKHRLPRFFYRIDSWEQARELQATPHFALHELLVVDCREAKLLLEEFPHHVPCAILMLARYLEIFRTRVEAPVYIAANGGYRSCAHGVSSGASTHLWATAADIYRIGDTFLNDQASIEKYGQIAQSIGREVFVKPYGHTEGTTDDHLHIDLGYATHVPRECDEYISDVSKEA